MGSRVCEKCVPGKYLLDEGSDASAHTTIAKCLECTYGKYAEDWGTNECKMCPKGRYNDLQGQRYPNVCIVCSKGRYAASEGLQTCTGVCSAGTYLSDDGLDEANHDSASDCIVCASGQHSSVESEVCTMCVAGKYLADDGTSATAHAAVEKCLGCATGKFSDKGSAVCESCEAGTYNNQEDQPNRIACKVCASGQYSSAGATNCINCVAGKYLDDLGFHEISVSLKRNRRNRYRKSFLTLKSRHTCWILS